MDINIAALIKIKNNFGNVVFLCFASNIKTNKQTNEKNLDFVENYRLHSFHMIYKRWLSEYN